MLQIHKASAGSGKTYSLTREYLRLLLAEKPHGSSRYRLRRKESYGYGKPKAHGSILAITFTNKATEEMASRIISELYLLAHPRKVTITDPSGAVTSKLRQSPYLHEFMRDFDATAEEVRTCAERALKDLLYNFTFFSVSTIDSFFQKVLNTFTRELELTPTHSMELNDKYALAVATAKLLNSINAPAAHDPEGKQRRRRLEMWLRTYMTGQLAEGSSFNLFSRNSDVNRKLVSYMGFFFNEVYKLHRNRIDLYLEDTSRVLDLHKRLAESPFMGELAQDSPLMESAKRLHPKVDGLINGNLLKIVEEVVNGEVRENFSDTWNQALVNPEKRQRFKKTPLDPALDSELLTFMHEVTAFDATRRLYKLLAQNAHLLGIFGEINHFLEEFRAENDSLLLSDTGDLLNRIINEEETPFIYERLGTTIRHYLIDEFQDTSRMQWNNISPLLLESMSEENDNLIIGDEKQCIYRFRNSDPSLLGKNVEQLIEGRFPGYVEPRGTRIAENTNWRSSADVVRFNNSLFLEMAALMDKGLSSNPVQATYSGLIQQIAPSHADMPGYVKIVYPTMKELPQEENTDEPLPENHDGEREDSEGDSIETIQFSLMMREISRQLQAGYAPADIAILVRKSRQGKELIARMMKTMEDDSAWTHGVIPIMSSDSMSISLSPAVRMIISVLRLATQPVKVKTPDSEGNISEKVSAAYRRYRLMHRFELCRFELTAETDAEGNPILDENGQPVMRRLTTEEALRKAISVTEKPLGEADDPVQVRIDNDLLELASLDSPTLTSLTERIIARFLTPEARQKDNAFICAFQDLVLDFSEYGNNNLSEFLKWWDQTACETNVSAPDGMNAITVMTIHKAKGLEYPCVHIPYCSFEAVAQSIPRKLSIDWYELDPKYLPDIPAELVPPFIPIPNTRSNKKIPALAAQAEEWEAQQKIDNLNLAYVAMTRAVSELCVYCDSSFIISGEQYIARKMAEGKSKSSITKKQNEIENPDKWNMADYMLRALRDTSAMVQRQYVTSHVLPLELSRQEGKGDPRPVTADDILQWLTPLQPLRCDSPEGYEQYILGSPTTPQAKSGAVEVVEEMPAIAPTVEFPPEDPDGLEIPYHSLLDTYKVHEHNDLATTMEFEELVDFNFNDDRHRGIFLHGVLSRVRYPSELPRALHAMAYRYRLTPSQKEECRRMLSAALADPRVQSWFNGFRRVLNERTLNGIFRRRRPDRVVWLEDDTPVVIDYKFGHINHPAYQEQVRDYVNLLALAGHPGAEGYLWFPLSGEIIKVV